MDPQTSATLRFRRPVLQARGYVPQWRGLDRSKFLCLDLNESNRPIPDTVLNALTKYLATNGVHTYPESGRLAEPLAFYCGVSPDCLLATNGSDQAIDLCLRTFLADGRRMLVARPEFSIFGHVADLAGARIDGVPYHDNLDFPYAEFMRAAEAHKPDLIVIINPNNPTGTSVDADFIEEVASRYPDIPVIVDEAYYEYTGRTVAGLIGSHRNIIVLRTFSKAFAMAGLRLGYVIADPLVVAQIAKLRGPFDVNELAVVAAEAQLAELDSMRRYVREVVHESKPMVVDFFSRIGIPTWPGEANFVLVRPLACDEAVQFLREHGILVRTMGAALLTGMFRMSMGSPGQMARFIRVYEAYAANGRDRADHAAGSELGGNP